MKSKIEKIAQHVLLYIIGYVVFVNLGFFLGYAMQAWYVPVTLGSYLAVLFWLSYMRQGKLPGRGTLLVLLLVVALWICTSIFGMTLDGSYDGQNYHQSAVIALANGWNPLTDPSGTSVTQAKAFVEGYPKSLWILQAGIYQQTHRINSATVTNLLALLMAGAFAYALFLRLGMARPWAGILAGLLAVHVELIRGMFSFMAEGFGYAMMVIAVCSLVSLIRDDDTRWSLASFLAAWILMVGSKFSNLSVAGLLALVFLFYYFLIRKGHRSSGKIIAAFVLMGLITLFIPYGTNSLRHRAPLYPSNEAWASYDLRVQNIPHNLKGRSRPVLLFYGIYSKMQASSAADSIRNIAELKVPFTFSHQELIDFVDNFQGRVGSEGVWFSGIFTLSLVFLVYLLRGVRNNNDDHHNLLRIVVLIVCLVMVVALVNPVPNKLRYAPVITWIPLVVLVALILWKEKPRWARRAAIIGAVLIGCNTLLMLVPTVNTRIHEFKSAHQQLARMRDTGKTYEVRAPFASTYVRLAEYGIHSVPKETLSCKAPKMIELTAYTATYCP